MPAAKVYVGLDDAAGATRPSDAVLLPSTLALAGRHAVSLIQERAGAAVGAGEERREEADREAALLQHRSRQAGEAGGSAGTAGAAGRGAKKPSWFKM